MSNNNSILYEREGEVAIVTLNLPAKLNPIAIPLQQRLREVLAEIREDKSVRAVVLTGAGKAFCVGADLSSMGGSSNPDQTQGQRTSEMMESLSNKLIMDLRELPVPVVSAVNGPAAGAGVGVALAADVVLAAKSAYFYLPFLPKLGIVPDLGTTWFLPRLVGRSRALAMSLLNERLSADKAADWGLVWAVVDDTELRSQAIATARKLASLPAHATVEARRALDAAEHNSLPQQLDYERLRQSELIDLPSFSEGVQAFMQKRDPVFPGR